MSNFADNTFEGVYTIKITLTNAYTTANPSVVNYYEFDVDVQYNCDVADITVSGSIPAMTYTIYASSPAAPTINQFSTDSRCTLTYSLLVNSLDPTDPAKLSTEERSIVEFNPSTKDITIYSENNEHGDKTITIQVKAALTSTNFETLSFNLVTTRDCNFASLDIDSSIERTLEYEINKDAPILMSVVFGTIFSTDDAYCPFTYQRLTYDSSNVITEW